MPKEGFFACTRAHLSPVYERPHYTLVPHYCMSFPGCSLSYDRNSTLGDDVLHAHFFFFWPAFCLLC